MKRVFHSVIVIIFLAVLNQSVVQAQRSRPPEDFMGLDLNKVKEAYEKAILSGDNAFTIHYAEALYYAARYKEAIQMFHSAERLGLITTPRQKRNYVHAARLTGEESPYFQDTGYFSRDLEMEVSIRPFCSNSAQEDFAPFFWNDIVFITSSRGEAEDHYLFTNLPFLNVHAFINDCIDIGIPAFLPQNINQSMHNGPIAISADGSLVVVNRNHATPTGQGVYNLYLDYYRRSGNRWSREMLFPFVGLEFSVQHPFYSDKDSLLYFSSDVPGGYGGFDLYTSKWDGNSWGRPVNLGPEINSVHDEVFPSLSPDGDLIFATNHIETNGGLDLVLYRDSVRYLFPEPFNTVFDDFAISFKDATSGYFTSNRQRDVFDDDIYVFSMREKLRPEFDFFVEVLDHDSREPIEGVSVNYRSEAAGTSGDLLTSVNGDGFLHRGPALFHEYHFKLQKQGYLPDNPSSSDFVLRGDVYYLTLLLKREPTPLEILGEETLAQGFFVVYFDNDHPNPRTRLERTTLSYEQTYYAFQLRREDFYRNSLNPRHELDAFFRDVEKGMEQLRWLASFLKEELSQGRHYTIVFTSHASPLAPSDYNMILSKRRFSSVENFLMGWNYGVLAPFIETGRLDYANEPFGSIQARPGISDDRGDPSRSIYSVEASRERRVTISWRRSNGERMQPEPRLTPRPEPSPRPQRSPDNENPRDSAPGSLPQAEPTPGAAQVTPSAAESAPETPAAAPAVATTPAPEPPPVRSPAPAAESQQTPAPYHVIVASHRNLADAESEAESLRRRGNSAARVLIPASGGNYRVAYGSYGTLDEASAVIRQIRTTVRADAWVLRQ